MILLKNYNLFIMLKNLKIYTCRVNIKNILVIYYFFIFLAALSIFIQDIYGHISFFGESFYWKVRYGKLGYSSITGSVNIFLIKI